MLRYAIASKSDIIEKKLFATFQYSYEQSFNASPLSYLPIITSEDKRKIILSRWGYLPKGEKNSDTTKYIHAEGERIHLNKHYLTAIRQRRCIVLANCFYVWHPASKQPYLIHLTDRKMFSFAGVYRIWKNIETKQEIHSFAILTTEPNKIMQVLGQNNMPVILTDSQANKWLKFETPLKDITPIATSVYSTNLMNGYPVGLDINVQGNNYKELMNPIGEKVIQEVNIPIESNKRRRDKGGGDSRSFIEKH